MKARKPAAMLGVAAILGLSLAVGAVLPANAVSLWPKGFQPKQMMINVLSSVLASAGGDSPLKRAVIAADQTYDHSWEGLEEQWKLPSKGAPQSYEDYVIQRQEYFAANNLTSKPGEISHPNNQNKKFVRTAKVPATKAKSLAKAGIGIGLGVGAGVGFEYRGDIAGGVASFVGVDAQGVVCGMDADEFGAATGFVNWLSGQECDPYAVGGDFVPNTDAEGGLTMEFDGISFQGSWVGTPSAGNPNSYAAYACFGGPAKDSTYTHVFKNFQGQPERTGLYKLSNYPRLQEAGVCPVGTMFSDLYFGSGAEVRARMDTYQPLCLGTARDVEMNLCSGSAGQPVTSTTNPPRVLTCTVTGTDGKTYTQDSEVYTQEDGTVPQPECPALPEGVGVQGVQLDETNQETGKKTPLLDESTTDEYNAWWQAFPECREGACSLDLIKKDKNTSCFDSISMADACQEWMKDKQKAENYQCRYGVHDVSITECYAYADVFYPEKVAAGEGYADPLTGESVKGQSSPKAATRALSRTITDPRDMTGCLDTGWAQANPVEWVMVPVQCSLQWAFAPSPKTMEVAGLAMQNDWNKKPPAQVVNAVSNWNFAPTASGCSTPLTLMGRTIVMADACPGGNAEGLAKLARGVGVAVFVVLDVIFLRRMTEKSVDA